MKDYGQRQMLNFGHTVGHAVELVNDFSHGYAVSIGMLKELELTEEFGITEGSVRINLLALLKQLGIEIMENPKMNLGAIAHDKKINGDTIMFPVVFKEGQSKIVEMPMAGLVRFIKKLS